MMTLMEPAVEMKIFGTQCSGWVSDENVQVHLTDWSGRVPFEDIDNELKRLKDFIAELEAAVAARRAEKAQAPE